MLPIWFLVALVTLAAAIGIAFYVTRPLRVRKAAHTILAERTATVDRLLDFSQTIQGAGKPDQVFATLSHFLRSELTLSGLAILTSDADVVPAIQLRTAWPDNL